MKDWTDWFLVLGFGFIVVILVSLIIASCMTPTTYKRLEGPVTIIFRNGQMATCEAVRREAGGPSMYHCIQSDGVLEVNPHHIGSLKAPTMEWR